MSASTLKVFLHQNDLYINEVQYVLSLFQPVLGVAFFSIPECQHAELEIGSNNERGYTVCLPYWENLSEGKFQECHRIFENFGENQFSIEKIFHLINCVQEYDCPPGDRYGRFTYEQSWQYRKSNIEVNLVLDLMRSFLNQYAGGIKTRTFKTKIFLSHDIDTLHGELLQNGYYFLKTKQIHKLRSVIFNLFMRKPGWANIDFINKIHDDYHVKHAYFWLTTQKTANGIKNADYSLHELKTYSSLCSSNGLHKSSTHKSHKSEKALLPFECVANRNHFLQYNVPQLWEQVDDGELQLDASMGFAEHFGFRNSYGYIFRPYNLKTRVSYRHVSVPLQVMDATFRNYLGIPVEKTAETIINFIEKNNQNCVLSLLWHNTFFTDGKYEGYLHQYLKVLEYIVECGFETVDFDDIIRLECNN